MRQQLFFYETSIFMVFMASFQLEINKMDPSQSTAISTLSQLYIAFKKKKKKKKKNIYIYIYIHTVHTHTHARKARTHSIFYYCLSINTTKTFNKNNDKIISNIFYNKKLFW